MSSEDVTILEISLDSVITQIPLKVALIDTIGGSIAKLIDNGIETTFGGSCLPTAIKDFEKVFSKDGNLVTVKTNN